MESPGYEHMLYSTHPPLYITQPNPDARTACSFKEEDIKSACSFLEINEHNWSGVYMPYCDRLTIEENPWLLRMAEVPAPAPPPFRTVDLSPPAPTQTQDLHSEMESQAEEGCLEQVHTMVVGEVLKDINTACKLLNIAPDPMDWTCTHVQKWLLWTEHQYRLPHISMVFQELTGSSLCSMTEADFRQRTSQFGDMLYAHLDIWRSAAAMKGRSPTENEKSGDDDSWSDMVCNYPSQPIHLWQFLRDLLRKPHNYSRCIRWLNKDKGIFKIEDSAHVARLWGIRKNRPAMNYDKLSRSIRQYYKKGIIRKPDVSGRLVYQFVHPVW